MLSLLRQHRFKKIMLLSFFYKRRVLFWRPSSFCSVSVLTFSSSSSRRYNFHSPPSHDSHSCSLTVTQLLATTCPSCHHCILALLHWLNSSWRVVPTVSPSRSRSVSLVLALTHSSTQSGSRSRPWKVSFISVFGCFCVSVFGHENVC